MTRTVGRQFGLIAMTWGVVFSCFVMIGCRTTTDHAEALRRPIASTEAGRIGSCLDLPLRNQENAEFWQMMDFYRFEHEVKCFDLALLKSYPYYDPDQKKIIAVLELIAGGDKKEAERQLTALKMIPESRKYVSILAWLEKSLYFDIYRVRGLNNASNCPSTAEIFAPRKFRFHEPTATLPFTSQFYPIKVMITIDGQRTPMIFDTGAPCSMLSHHTAAKLNLKMKTLWQSSPDKDGSSSLMSANKIELGTLSILNQPFYVHDGDHDIIGWDVLKELKIQITDNTISFSAPILSKDGRQRNLVDFGCRALVRIDSESNDDFIYFILDTGATGTFVCPNYLRRSGDLSERLPLGWTLCRTFDGYQSSVHKAYPRLSGRIGGTAISLSDVAVGDPVGEYYGALGMELPDMEIDAINGLFLISGKPTLNFFKPVMVDSPNPFVRYPAIAGVALMIVPAITIGLCAWPFGEPARDNTAAFALNTGEIIVGSVPWLFTNAGLCPQPKYAVLPAVCRVE
ncbi:MAG: aspartyl protease family protein [Verrucomicrobia bacterium]|nr:aspartyl protease family protein [Verrucomicrobiota bacterium]MBU4290768.1 aspartyl protease family protein [Verrucomicrobiota bacterium]MBU4429757.1 aspartyl protease family protein [Verrucomicrobiota bacterium]MBU4497440.1 aspartyl protease family protein [Verrucomicrobiota bacterium]MCG2681640.1 aspartyl protease family protein [Kiritimatiellia bacterium]